MRPTFTVVVSDDAAAVPLLLSLAPPAKTSEETMSRTYFQKLKITVIDNVFFI